MHHPCEGLGLIADVLSCIAVLGANVCPGRQKEIARHWVARSNSAVGSASVPARGRDLFSGEPSSLVGFHWHRDILDLPRGATLLASSAPAARQAFRYGKNAYGLLFHMEVTFLSVDSTVSNTLTKVAKHLDSEAERLEGERPSEPDWDGDRSTAASHREIDIDELFRDL